LIALGNQAPNMDDPATRIPGVFNERDTTREIFDTVDGTDLRCRTPEFAGISVFPIASLDLNLIYLYLPKFDCTWQSSAQYG
jgi:hypothetical protein